jgi:hypothetical protein
MNAVFCIRYNTIETKEVARIGYNRFLFPHEYSGEERGALPQGIHLSKFYTYDRVVLHVKLGLFLHLRLSYVFL